MTLDSWTFETTLIVALLAALTVGVWRWRRFRWRRTSRFAVLLVAQVLVLALGFNAINISGRFFADWKDVVGVGSVATMGTVDRHARPGAFPAADNDWRVTPAERAVDRAEAAESSVQFVTIRGAVTGYSLLARVYLPGSYTIDRHRRYPVIELEAGYPGSSRTWWDYLHLKSVLDGLIASDRMPAVIVVSTSQNPRRGNDSECVNADPGQVPGSLADTYLAHDVPAFIQSHYRAGISRVDWVDGGFSTGGFCAANLVLRHPSTYAGAVVLSGYFVPIVDHTTGPLYASRQERDANTPDLLVRRRHPPIALFLGAAQNDSQDMAVLTAMQPRRRSLIRSEWSPRLREAIRPGPGGH